MAKCEFLPGTFKRRLTIQTLTQTSDGQGGFTETWTNGDVIWASLEPLKSYERFQAMQMQTPITHKIVTRYRNDITTETRLTFGARVLEVKEVRNLNEDNRFLEIKAVERA